MKKSSNTIWNRTFTCAMLAFACVSLSQYIVNPLVKSYALYLGAGAVLSGLMYGLYNGTAFAMRPIAGPALVKLDKKKLALAAYGLGIVVNISYCLFNSIPLFIAARVLHGIQFSILGALTTTIASDSLPKEKMGSGLGVFGLSGLLSTAIGPTIGLEVRKWGTAHIGGELGGYKAVFFVSACIILIALIPVILMKPKKRTREEIASTGAWYKNIIAVHAIPAAFVNMFFAFCYAVINSNMVSYGQEKGFSGISIFFTVYAFSMLVTKPLAGRITDKYGPPAVFYPSVFLYMLGFFLLWRAHSVFMVYVCAFLSACGYGAAYPMFQTTCFKTVPPLQRGVASNTSYLGVDLGQFCGPLMAGVVEKWFADSPDKYARVFMCCMIPLAFCVVVFTIFWPRIKRRIEYIASLEAEA